MNGDGGREEGAEARVGVGSFRGARLASEEGVRRARSGAMLCPDPRGRPPLHRAGHKAG